MLAHLYAFGTFVVDLCRVCGLRPRSDQRCAVTIPWFATDQRSSPILRTPVPTFDAIANKPETTAASLRTFLFTTHGKVINPPGMPNPELADYQMNEVIAYKPSTEELKPLSKAI